MSKSAGLTVSDEEVFETILRMLRSSGNSEAASLLGESRWRFEQTGYDNWNGGTWIYKLYVEVDAGIYAALDDRREKIKEEIERQLTEVTRPLSSDWYHVQLAPLVVTMTGRPDLRGGAVSRETRQNIIGFLSNEHISWHGQLAQTDFLSELYDLRTLPSDDPRYGNAIEDIRQHCVLNDDWPLEWVYKDGRINLLEGADDGFLRFVELLVDPRVRPKSDETSKLAERLDAELRRDGWTLAEIETLAGGKMRIVPCHAAYDRAQATLRHTAVALNSPWMHQEIARIEAAVESDPSLAIGTAKDLVETCCKHVADRLAFTIPAGAKFPEVVRTTLKELQLVPEKIADRKKGAEVIKRILGNFVQLTQGLAELRNLYGSGHGRDSSKRGLEPRHARLAVSAAAAFAEFVVSTLKVRESKIERAS
jgi:AbiJ N-terminal domain 3/Abortive infection C-terminus